MALWKHAGKRLTIIIGDAAGYELCHKVSIVGAVLRTNPDPIADLGSQLLRVMQSGSRPGF